MDQPIWIVVFPARAGMNRMQTTPDMLVLCVPRAGGDEPGARDARRSKFQCSPRGRG